MLNKPRPALTMGLFAAAAYVCWRGYSQYTTGLFTEHPTLVLSHVGNAIALCALGLRWAKPEWKKPAMIAAVGAAVLGFVFAQVKGS